MKTVIIKPIHISKFSGISAHRNTKTTIGPELRMSGGGMYKTGLTEAEERKFEKALGLKEGELNARSEWWGNNISIKLNNDKVTFFYVDTTPIQELKYKILLQSTKVANDETEISKYPGVGFFIYDENLKAEKEAAEIDIEISAYEILTSMNSDEKRELLKVLTEGKKRGIDEFSELVIKGYLVKELKADPKRFVKVAKDQTLKTKALVADLLENDIIQRTGNFYRNGDDIIGNSTDEVVEYFSNPKNESVKLALETKLKKSKKTKVTE